MAGNYISDSMHGKHLIILFAVCLKYLLNCNKCCYSFLQFYLDVLQFWLDKNINFQRLLNGLFCKLRSG